MNSTSIGVDVGGTFTDVVCVSKDGGLIAAKVPSTPTQPHVGVLNAVERSLREAALTPGSVERFIHGTTVATNAIIERKGARIGILMTAGFEDTIEIGRYKRSENYDIWYDHETPVFLAPARRRRGILERVDSTGAVIQPLHEEQVAEAVRSLVEGHSVEAIAVCYLFSFRNPGHELRTRGIVQELYPSLAVSLSSEVSPEIREYERLCVTAFDAYVRPVIARYVSKLSSSLAEFRIPAPLQVMESRGSIADARLIVERPSTTIKSGPAAGVMGALNAAARSGYPNIISIDIGGTSSDVSLAVDDVPVRSREGKVVTYPVRVPMVDVNSIGAGGGSIAWFDRAGGLHVGPGSAGSDPGPACYGRGGQEATVTDASVVLGYINPNYFAGGTFSLDTDLAVAAVERVGSRLGVGTRDAALGIHRIINASMTDQIRLISIGRGYDPRGFALVLLGGAGGLHGCKLAEELGISTLVVPWLPGVLSAFGLLVTNVEFEQTLTFHVRLDAVASGADPSRLEFMDAFARLDKAGFVAMRKQNISPNAVIIKRSLDVRYIGQSYELEVPIDHDLTRFATDAVTTAFETKHRELYGHVRSGVGLEIINLRTVHINELPSPDHPIRATEELSWQHARKGIREVYYGDDGILPTPVYERSLLPIGSRIEGPTILEQIDTTVVVQPGWTGVVDDVGQLILTRR